jgi:hypothetical protein
MISAEEIKALMAPKLMRVTMNADMQVISELPCELTREQQAIRTLQTLLNQAAEASAKIAAVAKFVPNDQAFGIWTRDGSDGMTRISAADIHALAEALAAIEPYRTKEGEYAPQTKN